MDFDFSGKVVLITGASAGIGEATAILFAKLGAKLSLVGRNEKNLQDVAKRCAGEKGIETLAIIADLATDEGCEITAKKTLERFGRLDILVNNAGIAARSCIQHTDMAIFDSVFNTNLRGVYNLTRLLAPSLLAAKGNVVNVSSIHGSLVAVGSLPYGMSKAALDHFTRLTSLELAPKGVRVNAVSPGVTVSSIIPRLLNYSPEQYAKWLEQATTQIPMGEVCAGSDVAKAIVFLASGHCRLVTGVVLPVDGGLRYGDMTGYGQENN